MRTTIQNITVMVSMPSWRSVSLSTERANDGSAALTMTRRPAAVETQRIASKLGAILAICVMLCALAAHPGLKLPVIPGRVVDATISDSILSQTKHVVLSARSERVYTQSNDGSLSHPLWLNASLGDFVVLRRILASDAASARHGILTDAPCSTNPVRGPPIV